MGTNLYYLKARLYSAEWGRFISPDSVEYLDHETIGGLNLYCYCENDLVNKYDPSGHFAISALIIGLVAGAGIGFGTAAYIDYKDDKQLFDGSVAWYDYLGATLLGGAIGGIVKGSFQALTIAGKALIVSQSVGLLLGIAAVTNFAAGVAGYVMHTAGSETESFNILKGISEGIGQTGKGVLSFFTAGMYVGSGVWKVGVGAKNTFSSIIGRAAGRFIANYVPNYMLENLF